MNQARQAELEQIAREWLASPDNECTLSSKGMPYEFQVQSLAALLASREQAVLEEAAQVNEILILEHDAGSPGISVLQVAACRIRQLAQDRKV